jgi:guanylate cyclase
VWVALLKSIERIGEDPDDSLELRSQKRVLVVLSVVVAILAIGWGSVYLAFGEPLAAAIPWTYTGAVTVSLAVFALSGRYAIFRFTQLLLMLLLPFLLQVALGGFVNASAVIIWSLLAPLGALAMSGRREAFPWFIAYANLVVIAQLLQPSLRIDSNLPVPLIAGFFVANVVAATGVAFFALNYFVGQKDEILRLLDVERGKSERLLLNVLPREIAERLKESDGTIATRYPSVTVLFTDVVGFTPLSEELEAEEVVGVLNDVFSYFDSLVDVYGLEKIRTAGDSYMVAAGVPTPRDDHAQVLAELALAMFRYEPASQVRRAAPLSFRIGMSSGPVVAGVIGTAKFQYDVWGDTVNTASRMETHGVPGRIQISPSAYQLLKDDFECEPRGLVDVKGKGPMETWFLLRARRSG